MRDDGWTFVARFLLVLSVALATGNLTGLALLRLWG